MNENVTIASINGAKLIVEEHIAYTAKGFVKLGDGSKKASRAIFLINDTKLSQCLSNLPYGIVDKRITGIGGTTLELAARRNSIIVEPLKSIASSKASIKKDQYLYVGSKIGEYKNTTSKEDIKRYHESDREYKKIIVVADSLMKVVEAIGNNIFHDYFIVLDEIDSFQCDSDFRSAMETCLDIYKKFSPFNRCMITATFIEFSDPELKDEHLTLIDYATPLSRDLNLINTITVKAVVAEEINKHLLNNSKIVIAYNSIDDTFDIITILIERFNIDLADIKIMCSQSNKKKAGIYFGEMENGKLNSKITFLTSAYFTGIDINEKYHSIAVSNSKIRHSLLSDHKLKQIAGRCRNGLLSETIIYNSKDLNKEIYTKQILFDLANKFRKGFECFDNQFDDDPKSQSFLKDIHENLIKNSAYLGYRLVRIGINKKREIAYFNIDAFLEGQRIQQDLYSNDDQLRIHLESQKHHVNFQKLNLKWESEFEKNIYSEERKEELRIEAIEELRMSNIKNDHDIDDLIYNSGSDLQSKLYTQFKELYKFIDKGTLIDKINELSTSRDAKEFNFFKIAVKFQALDNTNLFKSQLLVNFPIGTVVTTTDVQITLNKIYSQTGLIKNPFSTPGSAWKRFTCFFETKYKKKKGDAGKKQFEIIGNNPDKIQVTSITFDHKNLNI